MSEKEPYPRSGFLEAIFEARAVWVWILRGILLFGLITGTVHLADTFGLPGRRNAVQTDAVFSMNIEAWHQAGYQGAGIAIAIASTGFRHYARRAFRELPAYWKIQKLTYGREVKRTVEEISRGTALAEILFDIAPQATLILIDITDDAGHLLRALKELSSEEPIILLIPSTLVAGFSQDARRRVEEHIRRMHHLELLIVTDLPTEGISMTSPVFGGGLQVARFVSSEMSESTADALISAPGTAPTLTLGAEPSDDAESIYPLSGHDVAAAHVAAAAALVWQAHPELSAGALKEKLLDYARLSQGVSGASHPALRLPDPPT